MAQGFLGELELLVMLAVLQVGKEAYAVPIRTEIEQRTGRRVARGSIYVTLNRLEEKGFLRSTLSDPTPERGGKAKRIFAVEAAGLEAVRASHAMIGEMARGIPALEDA